MQEFKEETKSRGEKNGIKYKQELEDNQVKENNEGFDKTKNKQNEEDRKDNKDIIYIEDNGNSLEELEKSENDNQDNKDKVKYDLSNEYFIETKKYFQSFSENKDIGTLFHSQLNFIPYTENFIEEIKSNDMLYKFFSETEEVIRKSKQINILKNGLFYSKKKKLFFYCRKDEKIEDNYIADITNIECIDHEEYDKIHINVNKEKNIKDKFAISGDIRDNNSDNYDSKSEKRIKYKKNNYSFKNYIKKPKSNKITDLKNRDLGLESLVCFYFKELKLVSLPDIIFYLSYKANKYTKNINNINLYYEWDGCFLS